MATVQAISARETSSTWEFFYALDMALACLISYSVITYVLSPFLNRPDALLGGMWATVATVFVFREIRDSSLAAGISRLIATGVRSRCAWPTSWSCLSTRRAWPRCLASAL